MNVKHEESLLEYHLDEKLDESSFTYTRLAHNDDGDVSDCTLNDETHLEEVVKCDAVVLDSLMRGLELLDGDSIRDMEELITRQYIQYVIDLPLQLLILQLLQRILRKQIPHNLRIQPPLQIRLQIPMLIRSYILVDSLTDDE